jgi:outer membrane protein TolC
MNATSERFLCDCWPGRLVIGVAVLVLLLTGCNRAHYRRQADQDAYALIERGSVDPRWHSDRYQIQPDPRSRFFNPDDPDCLPMPPDDPTSHELMHCVDGMKGSKHWHRNGDTPFVENPNWRAMLPVDETGAVILNRETVVELALLHSREYQRQLEELYLSALDVSYERFLFDTRFFGGHSTFFTADGRLRGKTGAFPQWGQAQRTLAIDQDITLRRTFATGGELVAGMANSLVWQFSGDGSYGAFTLLDFSLVQPLLRGAGRAVALEDLTDAERALLANIRQMERFRRGFYGQLQVGINPGLSLSRSGIGLSLPPTSNVGGGFYGLLEEQVQIRNQRSNIDSLEDSLEMLQAAYDAGRIKNRYQVDLSRQALLNAQSRLLTLNTSHQDRLDSYKITLGLPPDTPVRIQDDLLKQFDLMAPEMLELREDLTQFRQRLLDESQPPPPDYLDQVAEITKRSAEQVKIVEQDIQALLKALPTRRKNLQRLASRPEFKTGEVDPMVADIAALDQRVDILRQGYADLLDRLQVTLTDLERYRPSTPVSAPDAPPNQPLSRDAVLQDAITRLSDQLLELSVLQSLARLDTVTILPVELEPEQALAIASQNRLDWMNAKAELVDQWRKIEIAADRLRAGLDVTFGGDLSTTDNNPLRFHGSTGRMRMGLEFDAPLTRLAERNQYRETQIRYEQARRNYYAFVDRINQNLRNTLRQLQVTQLNFEVRRAAVVVSITQVDIARMSLLEPPKAGQTSQAGATIGRDLVTAVTGLLDAQNSFLGVWVDYESQRMNLDFELGTMRLDARGIWIDPGALTAETLGPVDAAEGLSPNPGGESEEIPPGTKQAPPAPGAEVGVFPPPPLLPAPDTPDAPIPPATAALRPEVP